MRAPDCQLRDRCRNENEKCDFDPGVLPSLLVHKAFGFFIFFSVSRRLYLLMTQLTQRVKISYNLAALQRHELTKRPAWIPAHWEVVVHMASSSHTTLLFAPQTLIVIMFDNLCADSFPSIYPIELLGSAFPNKLFNKCL